MPAIRLLQVVDEPATEVIESAAGLWTAFVESLPRVGIALIIILIGWLASHVVRRSFARVLSRNRPPSFATVMSKIGGWVVLALAVLVAITVIFPSVRPVDLLAGLGFFSLAIGFAFQDILENTLAGVLLLFRQPFQSGDQIEVEGQIGTVEAITIRETRLRTFDGQLVVIPNRDVYKSVIKVRTHFPVRRLEFVVGVAYENDPRGAAEVIRNAVAHVEGVAEQPPPEAVVTKLGVSTVDIEVHFWGDPRQHEAVLTLDAAIRAAKTALDHAGIEMPADIVALQATPSFKAALTGEAEVTPGGAVKS